MDSLPTLRFDAAITGAAVVNGRKTLAEIEWVKLSDSYFSAEDQTPVATNPLATWELVGIPREGPVQVYRRPLDSLSERWILQHPRAIVRRDASVDPMPEDEFWALIDLLDGSSRAKSINRLVKALQERGDDDTARFAVALHTRLRELDHPANTIGSVGRGLKYISDDASEDRRAGIVVQGRARFEKALAKPGSVAGERGGAEPLTYVANRVLSTENEYVILNTGIDIRTGTNDDHWPPVEPEPPRPPWTEEEARKSWESEILSLARMFNETITPEDPWYDVLRQTTWYAVQWVAEDGGQLFETLSVFTQPKSTVVIKDEQRAADTQRLRELVAELVHSSGQTLVGEVDVDECGRPLPRRDIAVLEMPTLPTSR